METNTVVTSREAILQACRELVSQNGLEALSMRAVAQKCGVALGSLYNYFPSKNDLTLAAIESVWQDIFHMDQPCAATASFVQSVERIFNSIQAGMTAYPRFFTAHSISFAAGEKAEARHMMERYQAHMKEGLLASLERDPAVAKDAFDAAFSQPAFVDFVLASLLSLLVRRQPSCGMLLEMIRRSIYPRQELH